MASGKPNSPTAELHIQYELLQKEYQYEKELYRQQAQSAGIQRRIEQGLCWYPVKTGRSYYNSLNQLILEIEREADNDTEHSFEYGRPVCFFTPDTNGKLRYFNFSAVISYVQDNRIVIAMPNQEAMTQVLACTNPGIQLYFDETSYKTMFSALTDVIKAQDNRLALLRDALLGNLPVQHRELYPVRFPWLNASQEKAVNKVLCAREVAVVHGPPGTGKTTTLVEAVYETLHRETQVMICAQSNMAVDWISEKLIDRGVNVLRIGNPTRVNDKMLAFTYEKRFESHPAYSELWNIRKSIRETLSRIRKSQFSEKGSLRNRLSDLRDRAADLDIHINEDLFREARVIACTLVGAANRVLTHKRFSTLFIDEAAQALEAACWIAIAKADRVILAGDHCQLPPTIKCIEAAREGLEETLIQKIVRRKPETVSLLEVQYRMHEDIMRFSSQWFYHNRLQAAPEIRNRGILEYDTPVVWYDTSECNISEEFAGESQSRINKTEAEILTGQLKGYMEKIGSERILDEQIDFGLISPYKAQVRYIRQLLKNDRFFRPFRQLITVNTVDGFQGQERDVIFISLVRTNTTGSIGFLHELRRMNVAITRARMKLAILGDSSTLTRHPFYKALFEYIQEHGLIIPLQVL